MELLELDIDTFVHAITELHRVFADLLDAFAALPQDTHANVLELLLLFGHKLFHLPLLFIYDVVHLSEYILCGLIKLRMLLLLESPHGCQVTLLVNLDGFFEIQYVIEPRATCGYTILRLLNHLFLVHLDFYLILK